MPTIEAPPKMEAPPKVNYETPAVEEVDTGGTPIVTAPKGSV